MALLFTQEWIQQDLSNVWWFSWPQNSYRKAAINFMEQQQIDFLSYKRAAEMMNQQDQILEKRQVSTWRLAKVQSSGEHIFYLLEGNRNVTEMEFSFVRKDAVTLYSTTQSKNNWQWSWHEGEPEKRFQSPKKRILIQQLHKYASHIGHFSNAYPHQSFFQHVTELMHKTHTFICCSFAYPSSSNNFSWRKAQRKLSVLIP